MKRILFIPLLLIVSLLHAQSVKPVKPAPGDQQLPNHCVRKHTYGPETRMTFHPFDKAAQIQLISFDGVVTISDKKQFEIYSADPQMLEDTVMPLVVKERVLLNAEQIGQLTDLLFNYGCTGAHTVHDCYIPHHAITFADAEGKALAFIEICFQCANTRESDSRFHMEPLCADKLAMIKALFRDAGIKFGVSDRS
ncbi:hypothetical protein [Chitinophaga rhizophila]|uniref:Uncharacterized protein n=1 Tax=Chitinophaga rhizophila TaxID=2866212 RepID=A0ABS7GKR7_9BACT|nr:hypothetical protein [Chitinophaga rhizophila]MBW8688315.1 hypothetical protein [Chitinophaga rhizophila]